MLRSFIDDVVVVAKTVIASLLPRRIPDVFDWIEFRGVGRQVHEGELSGMVSAAEM